MPTYLVLCTWTEQGRREATSQPERASHVREFFAAETGGTVLGAYVTIGRFDEAWLVRVADDETLTRFLVFIAGRGYVTTETLRCFAPEEIRELL